MAFHGRPWLHFFVLGVLANFGLAKAVLDLIHEFHLCHQPDMLELPAS